MMISRHNDTTPSSHRQIIRSSDHQIMTSSHRGRLGRQGARPTLPGLELVEVHACRTTRHQSSRSPAVTRSNTLSAKHTDKNTNKKRRIFRGLASTATEHEKQKTFVLLGPVPSKATPETGQANYGRIERIGIQSDGGMKGDGVQGGVKEGVKTAVKECA
eukprot:3547331-Rhodomonas_salina.1